MLAGDLNIDLTIPIDRSFTVGGVSAEVQATATVQIEATIVDMSDLSQLSVGTFALELQGHAAGTALGQTFEVSVDSSTADGSFEVGETAQDVLGFVVEQTAAIEGSASVPLLPISVQIDGNLTATLSGEIDFNTWTYSATGHLSIASNLINETFSFEIVDQRLPELPEGVILPDPLLGSIDDLVWLDENRDGVQGDDEPGVADVVVNLLDPGVNGIVGDGDDALIASTITDALGSYDFSEILPGDYFLSFDLPPGLTFATEGADDTPSDSDVNPLTGLTERLSVSLRERLQSLDVGVVAGSAWQNFVNRHDVTGDNDVNIADLLTVVTDIFQNGLNRELPQPGASEPVTRFVDINGDGRLSLLDVRDLVVALRDQFHSAEGAGEGEPVFQPTPPVLFGGPLQPARSAAPAPSPTIGQESLPPPRRTAVNDRVIGPTFGGAFGLGRSAALAASEELFDLAPLVDEVAEDVAKAKKEGATEGSPDDQPSEH